MSKPEISAPIPDESLEAIVMNRPGTRKKLPTGEVVEEPSALTRFYLAYEFSGDIELKHKFALALLDYRTPDGKRFDDHRLLFEYLIPKDCVVDKGARAYKENLALEMMKRGIIDPQEEEARVAEGEVVRFVDGNELLSSLSGTLPIHVMGAITNVLLFANMTAEKRAALRSFTTKSLLRPYLEALKVRRPAGRIPVEQMIRELPEKIFDNADKATIAIMKEYFTMEMLILFNRGEVEGLRRMEGMIAVENNGLKQDFLNQIKNEFESVSKIQVPADFKEKVDWVERFKDDNLPFPGFLQKYFLYEYKTRGRLLLDADTGGSKTACGYLAMETMGADRVTVLGPAKSRETWKRENTRIHKPGMVPDFFEINSQSDLADPRVETAKFVFIGSEFIANTAGEEGATGGEAETEKTDDTLDESIGRGTRARKTLNDLIDALVTRRRTDGLIIDESDDFRNPKAKRTQIFVSLAQKMNEQYAKNAVREAGLADKARMPILALTATPISNGLEDMDVMLAVLYPDKFALPYGIETDRSGQKVIRFSDLCLRNPELAYSVLLGEKLIMQWTIEHLNSELQSAKDPETVSFQLSPAEMAVYRFILSQEMNFLDIVKSLNDFLINPAYLREAVLRDPADWDIPATPKDALGKRFNELYDAWKEWSKQSGGVKREKFSADWIAKYGDGEFLAACFFNRDLFLGVESLAMEIDDDTFKNDWHSSEVIINLKDGRNLMVSRKFLEIKKYLEVHAVGVDQKKLFIISPGRATGVVNEYGSGEADDGATLSLIENLRSLGILPADSMPKLDGTASMKKREEVATVFKTDGAKARVVVATMEAIKESMDFAIQETEGMKDIKGMDVFYLGWPWTYADLKQAKGRFVRPGLGKRFDINQHVLESANTIDEGKRDIVRLKYLRMQMALNGVVLSEEDRAFFDNAHTSQNFINGTDNPRDYYARDFFAQVRGMGEAEISAALSRETNGKTVAEILAEHYLNNGKDTFTRAGNNARLVAGLLKQANPKKVLVVGAGSCLVNRNLIEMNYPVEVDNYDMNGVMMEKAKEIFPNIGKTIVGNASELSGIEDESYDAIDCSLMLELTKVMEKKGQIFSGDMANIERVKVLRELNRALKIGGRLVITLPENTFHEENCELPVFLAALSKHFGFSVAGPTGLASATDIRPKRKIGYVMTLEKTGKPDITGLKIEDITFPSESEFVISRKSGKTRKQVSASGDYPIFDFKQFSIEDPLTGEETRVNYQPSEAVIFTAEALQADEVVSIGELEGEVLLKAVRNDIRERLKSKDAWQKKIWFDLIRKLQNENFGQRITHEQLLRLAEAIRDSGLGCPSTWVLDEIDGERIIRAKLEWAMRARK